MDLDRGARVLRTRSGNAIDTAEDVEIEDVYDMGNLLFSDPRGVPAAMYGTRRFNDEETGRTVVGERKLRDNSMRGSSMRKLESSVMGCYWLLGVLEDLLEQHGAISGPRKISLRMIRLLGRNPAETLADRRVAEVFAASYAKLRPERQAV